MRQEATPAGTIKFSHCYPKLERALNMDHEILTAHLLEVLIVNLEKLSSPFVSYDTDKGLFPLPNKGKYMLLLFLGQYGLFPTLRRWTEEKEEYYRDLTGKQFRIHITETS